jgi:predicted DNA repair protein MutK
MFLVGGGILVHGIPALHHRIENAGWFATAAVGVAAGIVAGAVALAAVKLAQAMIRRWDRSRA